MKLENMTAGQEIVSGIDKITQTILTEAEAAAKEILDKADQEAEEIRLSYETKAQNILSAAKDKAKKESTISHDRAISSAANHKRNLLLFKKGELVEKAFAEAEQAILSLDCEKYAALLSGILVHTIDEYLASEQLSVMYDGEEFVKETKLTLAMAERDEALGERLVSVASEKLAQNGKTIALAKADTTIGAGFVLIAGNIRMDASIGKLIASQKASLEAEVYRILFA